MMGSLKALQEWCRIQCEDYNDVDIKNMSTSFRDGLAFCAIIHRHRPDLIDFDSLSKENVYENNRLAFEVAEAELGIPALLDPEDMVSMKVPDRLSIITYVSQYYNFFTNKSQVGNPPSMKRPSGTGHNEPAQKRPATPLEDKVVEPEPSRPAPPGVEIEVDVAAKRSTLSSTCAACQKHVHLVQRFLVDGKLYHRNCFRCRECSSTLLPGSYKLGNDSGSLICTHHFSRPALASQNGRPDLSKRPAGVQSARVGRPTSPQTSPSGSDQTSPEVGIGGDHSTPINDSITTNSTNDSTTTTSTNDSTTTTSTNDSTTTTSTNDSITTTSTNDSIVTTLTNDSTTTTSTDDSIVTTLTSDSITTTPIDDSITTTPTSDSVMATPVPTNKTDSLEKERDGNREREETPPNPFGESDEEEEEAEGRKEEEKWVAAKEMAGGDLPPAPISHLGGPSRPVPAPRRAPEATPPPRPAPRIRPPRPMDMPAVNGERRRPVPAPKPRDRSHSPGSVSNMSSNTPKPKDPPWLALVQSESKKKPAPPRPPVGLATPANTGSLSSLKGGGSRPSTPPPPNPFGDDDDEDVEEEEEGAGGVETPPTVAASHPWYSIMRPAEATAADTPPGGGCSSRSASPGGSAGKKRHAPKPPTSNQVLPHSLPSSRSPSPALSVESLSSGSDHSSSHLPSRGATDSDQEHPFTKSVSEPSICGPSDSAPAPSSSSSAERLPRLSPSHSPPTTPPNTSSAPATPQANRSSIKGARPPPPRPPITASPLASGGAGPPSSNKRTCKENPFNRKASPSPVKSKGRPPRGPRPARPPAPGHGFPLIKRKVQSDQYIPVEDIHGEMGQLEKQLDELEQRGVELEKKLRDNPNDEEEERLLVDWFTLIHEKHLLVRREAELVYTAKQQNLEERQADVEYELRCLLNKPEKEWTEEDKSREQELMAELVTIIEQRNQIITCMDQDRQREEEEDKFVAAMLKKKDFQKEPDSERQQQKKKGGKFKPMKVLKRLSHKGEPGKSQSPRKDKS